MDLAAKRQCRPGRGVTLVEPPDPLTWVAYLEAGQLGTELDRNSLAAQLADGGIRPVRQVAVDGVWSALCFRPA